MAPPVSFDQQVQTNLPRVWESAEFSGDQLWLTFYLMGPPEKLQQISEALSARGWANVGGWEGAFLYPKVQVEKTVAAIVRIAETTQALCAPHSVEILLIDADVSPELDRSNFVTLYRA